MKRKQSNKRVGLALGSGGARGLAHIGVIKTLLANNIPIDYIAGSSAGALIGGVYDALGDIAHIEQIITSFSYRELFNIFFEPAFQSGILKGEKVTLFLEKIVGTRRIEDLATPYSAVATDIYTGEPIILDHGDLVTAVRASGSIPFFLKPVLIAGHYLIDGGVSLPVPASVVRQMGANTVIAVNLDTFFFPDKEVKENGKQPALVSTLSATLKTLRYNLARQNAKEADFVLAPHIPDVSPLKFIGGSWMIEEGARVARKALPEIKKTLETV